MIGEYADALFLTDLDGTLLGEDLRISPESASTLNRLIGDGVRVSVATARSRISAGRALAGLDLALPGAFINGAYLTKLGGGPLDGGFTLRPDTAAYLVEECLKRELHPIVFTIDDAGDEHVYYSGTFNPSEEKFVTERVSAGDTRFRKIEDVRDALGERVLTVVCVNTQEALAPLFQDWHIDPVLSCHFTPDIYTLGFYWLEVSDNRANKGTAAQALKDLTGADRLICFGDNLNDLPMFEVADEAYAVANAHPDVLAAADAVIGDHRDHSVARAILALTSGERG